MTQYNLGPVADRIFEDLRQELARGEEGDTPERRAIRARLNILITEVGEPDWRAKAWRKTWNKIMSGA